MNSKTKNTPNDKKVLYAIIALLSVALLLVSSKATQLQQNNSLTERQLFLSQRQPGMACGLFTQKQAEAFLENKEVAASGTIIDASAPTAASRPGSPRVDSCSFVGSATNGVYADIVIKTYRSEEDAKKYYQDSVKKVLFIQQQETNTSDQLHYAAGVHYGLLHNITLEVSAAKLGAIKGEEQRILSRKLFDDLAAKL